MSASPPTLVRRAVRPVALALASSLAAAVSGGPRQNDSHGLQVNLVNLPGVSYTICHDAVATELCSVVRESGLAVDVEPRH